jgi:hypothetical protein
MVVIVNLISENVDNSPGLRCPRSYPHDSGDINDLVPGHEWKVARVMSLASSSFSFHPILQYASCQRFEIVMGHNYKNVQKDPDFRIYMEP